MEAFNEYRYLFPARPKKDPILITGISMMQKLGYVAQKKKNGTCSVIYSKGNESLFKTRRPDIDDGEHRAWQPNSAHTEFFGSLGSKWNVFNAELLHNKGPSVKDELFIFDIVVHNGIYLVDTTFAERQVILHGMFSAKWKDEGDQYRVHKHVTIAKTFDSNFKEMFNNLHPLDEGLVFKLPRGKLRPCVAENSNDNWAQKCRHPKAKTYSF